MYKCLNSIDVSEEEEKRKIRNEKRRLKNIAKRSRKMEIRIKDRLKFKKLREKLRRDNSPGFVIIVPKCAAGKCYFCHKPIDSGNMCNRCAKKVRR